MAVLRQSRYLAVCALLAGLVLAGCTADQVDTTRPVPASPSEAYLSKPVASGWFRTVGRANGLVLIFECEQAATRDKPLQHRFVLFNENSETRSWNDALFVVNLKNADGYEDPDPNDGLVPTGFGAFQGDYPISNLSNYDFPGLVLPSGESTTHAGAWPVSDPPEDLPYEGLITPTFKGGDRDRAEALVSAPGLRVNIE